MATPPSPLEFPPIWSIDLDGIATPPLPKGTHLHNLIPPLRTPLPGGVTIRAGRLYFEIHQ
eukprot:1117868-Prorocentrum_minimum.AAC.1